MRRFNLLHAAAVLFVLATAACKESKTLAVDSASVAPEPAAIPAEASLYDRLGGQTAIVAVIDDFVANVAADKRINARFANTNIPHLKQMLVEQVCQATGGPCTYTGKSMRDAHKGMKVTDADFNALVEDLTKSLDKFKVGEKEKSELLTALGSMKGDIVGV